MSKIKVQITMEEDLLNDVNDYCDKFYINRSVMVTQACLQLINQQKLVDSFQELSIAIRKCVESGEFNTDTKRQLEQFETFCKLIVGK